MEKKIYAAALTPMTATLAADHQLLLQHIQWLLGQGANGIALLGTTGEANSFSLKERQLIIDAVVEGGVDPQLIMAGTGSCAYTETVALTRHALESGISDILMLPPFYYKQVDDAGLKAYFDLVLQKLGDDRVRIYLYHFPKMTGISFSRSLLESLIDQYPDQIVGMKDSGGDLHHMEEICRNFPGFRLYAGTERYLLPVLQAGGAGCISATANVTIAMMAEVLAHWRSDDAHLRQEGLTAVRSVFDGLPFTAILKQCLADMTRNPQWNHLRPPNAPVAQDVVVQTLAQLNALDFHPRGLLQYSG